MSSLNRKRLWWLATCVMFVACASAPAPTSTKKKKKKKKKRDEIALKKKKDAERNEDEEKPDKPSKRDKEKEDKDDEVAVADDDVTVVDDDGETPSKKKSKKEAAADKKRKKEEEAVAAAEKKREKAEEAKRKKEEAAEAAAEKKREKEEAAAAAAEKKREKEDAAAEKKRKKEEVAEEEPAADEEEAKPKKGKKTDKVAAKGKKAKQPVEEEPEVVAEEPPPEEEEAPKPVKAKTKPEKVAAKSKKSKSEPAEVDMTSDEAVIDMEDTSSDGSSLDKRVDDEPPAGRVAAIAVPGVDDDSETSVTAEATPTGPNPLSLTDRSLTLGDGKLAVHGGLRVGVITIAPMGAAKISSTATGFALGGTYGLSDTTEVGLDYTLGVSPGSAKGPLLLHGAYSLYKGKLDMAIAAGLAIDPTDLVDPTTMAATSNTYVSLQLGAWVRYHLNRKASLFTGLPALPSSAIGLTKNALSLPPQPYQISLGINNTGPIAIDVPVGFGYQINPQIYAFGALELAHVRIANTVNAFIFDRFIPISLGGFYSLAKLDIGATFSDDLKQGTDYLRFDTFVRYSIK